MISKNLVKFSKNLANLVNFTLEKKKSKFFFIFGVKKEKKIVRNKTRAYFIRKKAEGEIYKYAMYVYS